MAVDLDKYLPTMLKHLTHHVRSCRDDSCNDPERAFMNALDALVDDVLADGRRMSSSPAVSEMPKGSRFSDLMPLNPEEVGRLYEVLRGFRLRAGGSRDPELIPCVRGKRNQGLFYTPPIIVKFIVKCTLDCLKISAPAEYLRLRILDPAVGAGVFLVEALEQISERVRCVERREDVQSALAETIDRMWATGRSPDSEADLDTLIKVHIVENCLFGVDSDATAVRIAREVLRNRAYPCNYHYEIKINILQGNSLKGEADRIKNSESAEDLDRKHASSLGRSAAVGAHDFFHWPVRFPEVFSGTSSGFDAVIGNPPYEILSVKESGLDSRREEQAYFRQFFVTCSGKINTYRLMMERALQLLKDGGALGFIVPATLLGDSTAEKLRRMILDRTSVFKTVVIPEKAKIFQGVTQALLVLVTRRQDSVANLEPIFWNGDGPIPEHSDVSIPGVIIRKAGYRVPLVRTRNELELLEAVSRFPPLGGDSEFSAVGRIHQGEINLTVHRDFITTEKTSYRLVRGEHVAPLRVNHPAAGGNRLDWVLPRFVKTAGLKKGSRSFLSNDRANVWETERIVLARVVNMDTDRRLKAARVGPGVFLGDMTNFLVEPKLPINYLLGLLNSRLLNWRMKLTSTNNYISAAEILALPIPRMKDQELSEANLAQARAILSARVSAKQDTIKESVGKISGLAANHEDGQALIGKMIEWTVGMIQESEGCSRVESLWNILDSLVVALYGLDEPAMASTIQSVITSDNCQ